MPGFRTDIDRSVDPPADIKRFYEPLKLLDLQNNRLGGVQGGEAASALAALGSVTVAGEMDTLLLASCGVGPAALLKLATADRGGLDTHGTLATLVRTRDSIPILSFVLLQKADRT